MRCVSRSRAGSSEEKSTLPLWMNVATSWRRCFSKQALSSVIRIGFLPPTLMPRSSATYSVMPTEEHPDCDSAKAEGPSPARARPSCEKFCWAVEEVLERYFMTSASRTRTSEKKKNNPTAPRSCTHCQQTTEG